MQKITDTYKTPIRGGRSEKWWLNNPGQLDKGKNAKHRTQITSKTPDIDIRKFLDEFSLKGVEFGNWLGQGERYDHLLSAGAAINELSKLVGKNVGFDGNVGIAFGARGVKGAAAHFECVENMINLTKRSGAGTLAHEYGHAIDFNIGAFCDQHKTYAYLSGGRSTAATLPDNVGWEMRAMVNQIVDYVKTTDSFKKLFERTYPNSPYWHRRTEVFARFFEQYVAYKTQSKNAYLCKPWDKYVNGLNKLAYLQEDEFKQILPVADKLVTRIKDYVSGNGLPLKKAAYPTAIVYKPKDAPAPGTAATKQPQDTKATKNKTSIVTAVRDPKTGQAQLVITGAKKPVVSVGKEEKDAIMRVLTYKIKLHNENQSHYLFSPESSKIMPYERLLNRNKIVIKYQHMGNGTIEKEGIKVADIIPNYASKKVDGFYKELKPTVTYL